MAKLIFHVVGFPQQRAVRGGNARHAAAAAIDIKPPPSEFHRHDGGMGHLPAARIGRAPEGLSGFQFHGGEQGIVSARRENDRVAVNQRALAGVPRRNGRAKLGDQIHAPAQFPRGRVQAKDMALGVQGDDELAESAGTVRVIPWLRLTGRG